MEENSQTKQPNIKPNIKPNTTVEVMTLANQTTFVGKVEEFSGGVLTLRSSTGDDLPPVLYNKQIKLRFYQGAGTLVLYGKICGSSREIWKVDRLENQFAQEKRMFFRQHVDLEAQVMCVSRSASEPQLNRGSEWKPCKVEDISAGGILIHCREPFQVGDRLSVKNIQLVDETEPFSFVCRVLRSEPEGKGVRCICGCQLEALTPKEQERLFRAIFVAQRKDIQNRRPGPL